MPPIRSSRRVCGDVMNHSPFGHLRYALGLFFERVQKKVQFITLCITFIAGSFCHLSQQKLSLRAASYDVCTRPLAVIKNKKNDSTKRDER